VSVERGADLGWLVDRQVSSSKRQLLLFLRTVSSMLWTSSEVGNGRWRLCGSKKVVHEQKSGRVS
jgi:hypothetical protein